MALRRTLKWSMADVLYTVKRRASADSSSTGTGGGGGGGSSARSSLALHAAWQTWPPAAIRTLKQMLKHHGVSSASSANQRSTFFELLLSIMVNSSQSQT